MSRRTRVALLTRVTCELADGTVRTLHFTMPAQKRGRAIAAFVKPEHVPEFEGREAWFEVEKVPGEPWAYWRALRQVAPPAGYAATSWLDARSRP